MGKFFKGREKVVSSLVVPSLPGPEIDSLARVEPHLLSLLSPAAFETESYRVLGHLVAQMHAEAGLHVLAISSPSPGDGKTSNAINLAGVLAQQPAMRVLLLEAELRRPSIAKYLGIRDVCAGLAEAILEPGLPLESVVQPYQPFNIHLLLAGRPTASPYDLLKLPRFGTLLQEARKHYDYVVVDTPPLLPFADCRLIERWIDGWIVVVAAHEAPRQLLAEALNTTDPTKVVGVVLNKDDHQTIKDYNAYHYYAQSANGHHNGWRASRRRSSP